MDTTQSKPGIFSSQPVSFKFEGIAYQVTIQDVRLFPQGCSAIAVHPELIRGEPSVLLMDVGGWTVDLMRLDNGIPNASACRSLELGMIRCIDEAKEQVRRETGLSVTDAQVERVLAGQSCSMDENARSVIQNQGRIYTEALLSAAMEAGFDLKAGSDAGRGRSSSQGQRERTGRPVPGFCPFRRQGKRRRVRADFGPAFGRCGQEMSRPRFSFRPNLQNEEHRKAWDILQSVPEGQRNTFIARAILENTLRRVLREELQASPVQRESGQEDTIPQEMLRFLDSLS